METRLDGNNPAENAGAAAGGSAGGGFDRAFYLKTLKGLMDIDSTTGQYREMQDHICGFLDGLGIRHSEIRKGGVIAETGSGGEPLCITAHLDDIGLMVRHVNADGTLNVCPIGGLYPFYCVTENVRIHSQGGKVTTGSICRIPNSVHVTENELRGELPDFRTNVCVVIDEDVRSAADTKKLGIDTGDFIALEPRFTVAGDYIKSRFLDDKASAALLLMLLRETAEGRLDPPRKIYWYFAFYEEIGHGTVCLPPDVKDILAVDIAPVGPEQNSDERKVSIFAMDSRFPYHKGFTEELCDLAAASGIDYVTDVFTPHYGTDCDPSVTAGYDLRHAALGPGTLNSHGYERMHFDGIINTFDLLRKVAAG